MYVSPLYLLPLILTPINMLPLIFAQKENYQMPQRGETIGFNTFDTYQDFFIYINTSVVLERIYNLDKNGYNVCYYSYR